MIIPVKNMVCNRCIKTVTRIFQEAKIPVRNVMLGSVETETDLDIEEEKIIKPKLQEEGFEILADQKLKLVEQIKTAIIELVHESELDEMKENLSTWLSGRLLKDYHYLSNVFSSVENSTIEQYFILQKIEKVKEWLVYNEYTLNEMSIKLGYSSVAHLSSQFKKVTGFTPSAFKKLKVHNRKPLDQV